MKMGIWHQMGDRSQKLVLEQIQYGSGVGVIISPRDLVYKKAVDYSTQYRELDADVLVDQQYYRPGFVNQKLQTYPLYDFRASLSRLANLNNKECLEITNSLVSMNHNLGASALIAPAVLYEAGRRDISDLNARLFMCAKNAANQLGIPCYASVFLGRSATSSDNTTLVALSQATSLDADGWYFGFEFPQVERIPTIHNDILRFMMAGLTLSCTGKPVLHAYAGPMSLLSPAFGATGAGVGHFQTTWQFLSTRWEGVSGQGGGGDAPARFFSTALWGTIIYPDELIQLSQEIRRRILTVSPFSDRLRITGVVDWGRWEANKHLVSAISSSVQPIFNLSNPLRAVSSASKILSDAVEIHKLIGRGQIILNDNTNSYQANWLAALTDLIRERSSDYDYLSLMF